MPVGAAFIITTAGASTSQSTLVLLSALTAASQQPRNIRFLNKGTADIWVHFSSLAGAAAVIPTAGTTTVGTPQFSLWLEPQVDLVFTLPTPWQPVTAGSGIGIYINTISTSDDMKDLQQGNPDDMILLVIKALKKTRGAKE